MIRLARQQSDERQRGRRARAPDARDDRRAAARVGPCAPLGELHGGAGDRSAHGVRDASDEERVAHASARARARRARRQLELGERAAAGQAIAEVRDPGRPVAEPGWPAHRDALVAPTWVEDRRAVRLVAQPVEHDRAGGGEEAAAGGEVLGDLGLHCGRDVPGLLERSVRVAAARRVAEVAAAHDVIGLDRGRPSEHRRARESGKSTCRAGVVDEAQHLQLLVGREHGQDLAARARARWREVRVVRTLRCRVRGRQQCEREGPPQCARRS